MLETCIHASPRLQWAASGNSIRYDLRGRIQRSSRCDGKFEANDNKLQTHLHGYSSLNSWENGSETHIKVSTIVFPPPLQPTGEPHLWKESPCHSVPMAIEYRGHPHVQDNLNAARNLVLLAKKGQFFQ